MQALHAHIGKDGFRLRGTDSSRLDNFSDVVFGFALTLIVVSPTVPATYTELHNVLLGFGPFFICFVLFVSVWWAHFRFFRLYGLHDSWTIVINSVLLFTVLFFVYPLKFLFTIAAGSVAEHVFSSPYQSRELMMVYGAGFAAIYFSLAALHFNAWRQRIHLRLNALETTLTLSYLADAIGVGCVGLICCLVARLLPPERSGNAGWFFFLIFFWKTIHGRISRPRIHAAHARTSPEDRHALPHAS